MIDRKIFSQEIVLRAHIREAIKIVHSRRAIQEQKLLKEEGQLRSVIRKLINEADPAVSTDAVHSNTGINALEDLFANTNLLSVLRQGYKSLTTRKKTDPRKGPTKQRVSFMNHILTAVHSSLETEESRHMSLKPAISEDLQEELNISVGDRPEDNPAFIDVEKKEPTEEEEVEDFSIAGQDRTGRNSAYTNYKNVEKNIITKFDNLDDPEDREMFRDYLLTNLKLYFGRFEEELAEDLPAPEIDMPAEAEAVPGPEEEVELSPGEIVEWLSLSDTKS
jgi:hypothetical protein